MAIQDPNELEKVLFQRGQAKARAQAQHRHIHQAIDRDGQVTVWVVATGKTCRLWPVDAAELLARGLASLQEPEPVVEAAGEINPEPPTPPPAEVPEPAAPKPKSGRGKTKDSGAAAPEVPAPFEVPLT